MKIIKYAETFKNFNVGDIVWGCAFSRTIDTAGMLFYQEPILGMFVSRKTLKEAQNVNNFETIRYFVPFKKNRKGNNLTDLAWSKLVNINSRKYATTEYECIEIYNDLIQKEIDYHELLIDKMKEYFI